MKELQDKKQHEVLNLLLLTSILLVQNVEQNVANSKTRLIISTKILVPRWKETLSYAQTWYKYSYSDII